MNKKIVTICLVTVFLVIGALLFTMAKRARSRYFLIEKEADSLVISKDHTRILTISDIPAQFEPEKGKYIVRNGEKRIGDIGWRNVDLGYLDDHIRINVGETEYWILLAKYRDESGKIVYQVSYREVLDSPNKEIQGDLD